ncbi:MAG: hypothetical protein PHR62_09645, partial [Paludibacter sp.]|nr:hypothetical protein [Paludibacter sp.]
LVIFWWLSEMADKKSEYCLTMLKKFTFVVSIFLSKSIEQPLYELQPGKHQVRKHGSPRH